MMSTASTVEFAKYQGLGNDFILVRNTFHIAVAHWKLPVIGSNLHLTRCCKPDKQVQ